MCEKADNSKAQHAACLAFNGVFCGVLQQVIEKGTLCSVAGNQKSLSGTTKGPKKKVSKKAKAYS
jgi:hypothetical protein